MAGLPLTLWRFLAFTAAPEELNVARTTPSFHRPSWCAAACAAARNNVGRRIGAFVVRLVSVFARLLLRVGRWGHIKVTSLPVANPSVALRSEHKGLGLGTSINGENSIPLGSRISDDHTTSSSITIGSRQHRRRRNGFDSGSATFATSKGSSGTALCPPYGTGC